VTNTLDRAMAQLRGAIAARIAAQPSGDSRAVLVGLVGRGIQSSRTPAMHEREGARVGLRYTYILIDFDALGLADANLGGVIDAVEGFGFAGLNVTHPFKQTVLAHLDGLSPEAAAIGAVNTLVFDRSRRIGHNTDSWGFAESFREGLAGAPRQSVVQFGAGGAGAAVAHALLECGVAALTICDTEIERATTLAARLSQRFATKVEAVTDAALALAGADGIVNATPVGMDKYPGLPFPAALLQPRHWVAEIIYFPADTQLLQLARSLGCRTLAGTGMAVYQAVKAFELFTGVVPDRAAMTGHFRAAA
jgi:shikimate dehydrogenase